jgi:hypothetical protein
MKKLFTFFVAIFALGVLNAQNSLSPNQNLRHQAVKGMPRVHKTGFEHVGTLNSSVPSSNFGLRQSESMGTTFYDLQANASDNSRLINLGNGDVRGSWTFANVAAYSDRGMAYNKRTAGVWGAAPTARIENARTGFGSYVVTDNGTEFVVAHRVAAGIYYLRTSIRPQGGTTWAQADIPSATPFGFLWPRAAAANGKLHVIALTTPTAFGGTKVNGQDGCILYFRSSDNGTTWDKQDFLIPGLDSMVLANHGGESYTIDAEGDNVVVGVFPFLNDIVYFHSKDGGNTWEKHTVYNSPLNNHQFDEGYTANDVDALDANAPADDSLALWTTDEHGSIKVDVLGNVHVVYSAGYINDSDTASGFTWYPTSGSIVYWRSGLDDEDLVEKDGIIPGTIVGQAVDYNGNNTINVTGTTYNDYGASFSASMPTMGLNSGNGDVYIAYSVVDERYLSTLAVPQAFRHVHIVKITNNGMGREGPYDIMNPDVIDDILIPITENAFPFLAKNCDDKVHLMWIEDNVPGSHVTDAVTPEFPSLVQYLGFDPNVIVNSKEILPQSTVSINLMPNPASENLVVDLSFAQKAEEAVMIITDMTGRIVLTQNLGSFSADRLNVNVSQFQNGVYNLTIYTEKGFAGSKFSVVK